MNRKLRDVVILVATCLALVWCIPSVGQVLKGSISGTVVDPQGAVVSGAQVKATQTAENSVNTTTTDNAGLFRFNLIPSGNYKVEVSSKGFKTAVQNDVAVTAGHTSDLGTVKLAVGGATESVEVTAAAPLIETTQAQVTNTFSGTTLSTFAGIQENQGLDNLALFVPGVTAARDNGFSNTNGGSGFSVNGLRGRNNDQEIDGQNNNDNSVGGPGLFVSDTEFVQQYVLITNQFGPEYGRNAGSVVNIITKSGSNGWHGSIYETENNSILNSLDNSQKNTRICGTLPDNVTPGPGCLTKPPRENSEFGGFSVGGPVVKNKAFLFGGFDQQIVSQNSVFSSGGAVTPTPAGLAELAACFPGSTSLAALNKFGPYAISAGNPTPGNVQPLAVGPTCPGVQFGTVSRTVPQPQHFFNFVAKSDINVGSDTITSRYLFNRGNFFNLGDNGAAGYFFNEPALSQVMLVSWTHNLSARMVNEFRVSFGRLNVDFGGGNITGAAEPAAGQLDTALANIAFNSTATNLGFGPATNLPQQRIVNTWQAQDNWNWVLGKHQIKAGVNWTYQRSPNIFLPDINGAYRFSNWSAFANNTPNRVLVANGPSSLDFREYDTFAYFGDDWKMGKNFTLQLGLTWSYYGQPANLFNQITNARESNPATAFWATTEPTTGGFLNPGAAIPLSARIDPTIPAPKNSFGPSLGFAYSPQWGGFLTGRGKTVFRGGYRMLYDPPFYNIYLNIATAAPEVFLQSLTGSQLAGVTLPGVPTGPNVRSSLNSHLTLGVFDPRTFNQTGITPNFGPDKVQTWTLGLERELTKNAAVELRYVGNHAYNLFQTLDGNPQIGIDAAGNNGLQQDFPNLVAGGLTGCPAAQAFAPVAIGRANCNQGILRERTNTGFSNYQGLQAEFRANNLFKQLTIRGSYTYSKNLDNVSEIFSTFGGGNTVFAAQNPANQVNGPGEYSFSGLDYPNVFTVLFTEQLPFFKEQHGLVGHVFGGWSIAANYLVASGQRYTPSQLGDAVGGAAGDYYDTGYIGAFIGVDTAHPFLGSLSAPATAVGAFCGDELSTAACTAAFGATGVNQLISLNQLQSQSNSMLVSVTKNQVRYIINGGTAQAIFGTPFGNSPRNPASDAMSNIANLSIYKNFKLGEHESFEFHTTFLNAFNHSNYGSVDPFVDDANTVCASCNFGFGDPSLTGSITRTIVFGGKFTF
ncbi:MAG TPA: TonB-dependent receptor [Candidatus Angelobacter sp.]